MEASEGKKTVLKFEKIAPHVYAALHALERTGWVRRGVENPETVKEHTEALIVLAQSLMEMLTPEETDGLFDMLEVHDWPEAIHGDEVILELEPEKRTPLKDLKFENEKRALEHMCADLPNGAEILRLWLRFETSPDAAAAFARQLDKYQAVEKAFEYEEAQGIALFEQFRAYSLNFIDHPLLLERIEALIMKWEAKT